MKYHASLDGQVCKFLSCQVGLAAGTLVNSEFINLRTDVAEEARRINMHNTLTNHILPIYSFFYQFQEIGQKPSSHAKGLQLLRGSNPFDKVHIVIVILTREDRQKSVHSAWTRKRCSAVHVA